MSDQGQKYFCVTMHGRLVDFVDPDPDEIDVQDLAYALAIEPRFTGHVKRSGHAYGVAQHSVLVSRHVATHGGDREEQLAGLLHDAAEAYLHDLSTPLKRLIPGYREIEQRLLRAIFRRFNLPEVWAEFLPLRVKRADLVLLSTETRDLCHPRMREHIDVGLALPGSLTTWTPARAQRAFLQRFEELTS